MARWGLTLVMLVTTLTLFGGVSAASGNEPPLAEAGLDQTVDNGTTVYLDAGGSVDPDGTVTTVRWTVTDPGGTAVNVSDETGARTQFTPNRTGNYTANVSVTDDDGATRNDTLYVTVEERNGPTVTLIGPGQTTRDESTEFRVTATAGDADLRRLHWIENGSTEQTFDLTGNESNTTVNRTFSETRSLRIDATVQDIKGYSQTSSLRVDVVSSSAGRSFDRCPGGGSPYFVSGDFIGCNDGGADMIYEDRVLEANDRSGLWLYDNAAGGLVQMASEGEVEELQKRPSSSLTRDTVNRNYEESLEAGFLPTFDNQRPSQNGEEGSSGDTSSTDTSDDPSPPDNIPPTSPL